MAPRLGPATARSATSEGLHVQMLPDFDRADRIGEFWSYPQSRTFAELLIDCEEDRTLRAVLVGMLRFRLSCPRGGAQRTLLVERAAVSQAGGTPWYQQTRPS
jgi:hypothetical protein